MTRGQHDRSGVDCAKKAIVVRLESGQKEQWIVGKRIISMRVAASRPEASVTASVVSFVKRRKVTTSQHRKHNLDFY